MNRIVERFARLKKAGKKGFIVYIGAGDPNLEATRQLALAFDKARVDILELGVPFSDPLADGLVNQLAAQRGLASGATPPKVLETVAAIRSGSQLAIVRIQPGDARPDHPVASELFRNKRPQGRTGARGRGHGGEAHGCLLVERRAGRQG